MRGTLSHITNTSVDEMLLIVTLLGGLAGAICYTYNIYLLFMRVCVAYPHPVSSLLVGYWEQMVLSHCRQ